MPNNNKTSSPVSVSNTARSVPKNTDAKVEQLTQQLLKSDSTITDLKAELNKVRAYAESLKNENQELKTRLSQTKHDSQSSSDYNANSSVNGYSGSTSLDGYLLVS